MGRQVLDAFDCDVKTVLQMAISGNESNGK